MGGGGVQKCCIYNFVQYIYVMLRALRKQFSYVVFVILLFYVLDVVSITVYDRHTLLNIGSSFAQRKPDFKLLNAGTLFTDTALEPFVWAAQLRKRRRNRRKRAGVLVRLRRHPLWPPLPTILLANVQSLDDKLCELQARISCQWETRDCCIICLTETWMSAMVPDSSSQGSPCIARTERKSSQVKGPFFKGLFLYQQLVMWTYTRINPTAPLI